jgi:DNA-binding transcriptional LysR family regulator
MFQLNQLRCFVAVAEELHFGRAADRLHMTQPPLSRQIQVLERILGVRLLDRSSRAVTLTHAGAAFLLEARRVLRLAESAAVNARRIAQGDAGRLAIGFTAASGYSILPKLLQLARAELPNVDLTLREMVTQEQVEALIDGRIDLGLLRPPVNRLEFDTARLTNESLLAALPEGDPRLDKDMLELTDFDGTPFIMYSTEGAQYFHDILVSLFRSAGSAPVFVQHMSQIHSILALVHAGLGAALVPEAAVGLHFDAVHFRPVRTDPPKPVELVMTWRRSNPNPSLGKFLALRDDWSAA